MDRTRALRIVGIGLLLLAADGVKSVLVARRYVETDFVRPTVVVRNLRDVNPPTAPPQPPGRVRLVGIRFVGVWALRYRFDAWHEDAAATIIVLPIVPVAFVGATCR